MLSLNFSFRVFCWWISVWRSNLLKLLKELKFSNRFGNSIDFYIFIIMLVLIMNGNKIIWRCSVKSLFKVSIYFIIQLQFVFFHTTGLAKLISTALHPAKVLKWFFNNIYSILKLKHLENCFLHTNNLHQKIKFTMETESNGELAFLGTLSGWNNGKISVLVYQEPTHTGQ